MLDNFSNHIEQESKNCDSINAQWNAELNYFSSSVIQFCLFQLTNYYQKSSECIHFHCYTRLLPAMSALHPWLQLSEGRISEDVILNLDSIYLQKSAEYFGGDTFRTNEDGDLYKGMLCFMIVGLKNSIPCVIKSVPEKELRCQVIKDSLTECLKILHELKFIVRGFVCDDHVTNVSAYTKLLSDYNDNSLRQLIFT